MMVATRTVHPMKAARQSRLSMSGCRAAECLRRRGMGQSEIPAIASTAGGTFVGVSSALIQTGALSTAGATGGFLAAAIPIIGPAIAGVTIGLSLLFNRKGPQQKVATTEIVNAVEPLLQKNLQGYLDGPRTRSAQKQALENFDAAWTWVQQHCAIPVMGDPGQWCVQDRQAGACKWRDAAGACWNWFSGYRDPIANDPQVKDDSAGVVASDLVSSVSQAVGSAGVGWLLIPAAMLAAWWALS